MIANEGPIGRVTLSFSEIGDLLHAVDCRMKWLQERQTAADQDRRELRRLSELHKRLAEAELRLFCRVSGQFRDLNEGR